MKKLGIVVGAAAGLALVCSIAAYRRLKKKMLEMEVELYMKDDDSDCDVLCDKCNCGDHDSCVDCDFRNEAFDCDGHCNECHCGKQPECENCCCDDEEIPATEETSPDVKMESGEEGNA